MPLAYHLQNLLQILQFGNNSRKNIKNIGSYFSCCLHIYFHTNFENFFTNLSFYSSRDSWKLKPTNAMPTVPEHQIQWTVYCIWWPGTLRRLLFYTEESHPVETTPSMHVGKTDFHTSHVSCFVAGADNDRQLRSHRRRWVHQFGFLIFRTTHSSTSIPGVKLRRRWWDFPDTNTFTMSSRRNVESSVHRMLQKNEDFSFNFLSPELNFTKDYKRHIPNIYQTIYPC